MARLYFSLDDTSDGCRWWWFSIYPRYIFLCLKVQIQNSSFRHCSHWSWITQQDFRVMTIFLVKCQHGPFHILMIRQGLAAWLAVASLSGVLAWILYSVGLQVWYGSVARNFIHRQGASYGFDEGTLILSFFSACHPPPCDEAPWISGREAQWS